MLSPATTLIVAKFRPQTGDLRAYHPLICHMVDVSALALAVWQDHLGRHARLLIADGLGLSEEDAGRWVASLAGLHDLGKACPAFQLKDGDAPRRLRDVLPPLRHPSGARTPGHGSVSGHAVQSLLGSRYGLAREEAYQLALILAGHHGIFPLDLVDARGIRIGEPLPADQAAWGAVRTELFSELANLHGLGGRAPRRMPTPASMALAGLISVADWIGSNEAFFPWEPEGATDLTTYAEGAKRIASRSLRRIHWQRHRPAAGSRSFQSLFGFEPRPLQQVVEEIDAGRADLVIVEAPMGEGKTEAALLLADRWNSQGFGGAYVALPTQATANQLFSRVQRFLAHRFREERQAGEDVNLLLVHGGATLQDLDLLPTGVDDSDDAREGVVAAGEWFLQRKRALLAPYGVGTIDQSLLAVLQVKHVFVRLFGLAGKVVVIDEVHAYDTYMTGLLERLLEWLAALRAPVVLLSATLPSNRRDRLVRAYQDGIALSTGTAEPLPLAPYPRVTWLDGGQPRVSAFAAARRSQRSIEIAQVEDRPEAVLELLNRELDGGGCAAVICNTVTRAQETYRALRSKLGPENVGLFHARFVAEDRQRIESRCLAQFGAPTTDGSSRGRPRRYVLVATQVIEQSLDLDFDVMISDLAPIDLLLQRSGRLQRHDRGSRRHSPTLHVRWPEEQAGVPGLDRASTYVYDEHILLRTWYALRRRTAIQIPDDLQSLVDEVYADSDAAPNNATEALVERWEGSWQRMQNKRQEAEREAQDRRLPKPHLEDASLTSFVRQPRQDDAPDIHPALQAVTRLGQPSVPVVLLPLDSPLAPLNEADLTRDQIRKLLLRSVTVSSRLVLSKLFELPIPAPFARVPALRRHRLLLLDAHGHTTLGDAIIAYDQELGLTVSQPEEIDA